MSDFNLAAAPVIDDDHKMIGVVTVDDVLELLLPTGWRRDFGMSVGATNTAADTGFAGEVGQVRSRPQAAAARPVTASGVHHGSVVVRPVPAGATSLGDRLTMGHESEQP